MPFSKKTKIENDNAARVLPEVLERYLQLCFQYREVSNEINKFYKNKFSPETKSKESKTFLDMSAANKITEITKKSKELYDQIKEMENQHPQIGNIDSPGSRQNQRRLV